MPNGAQNSRDYVCIMSRKYEVARLGFQFLEHCMMIQVDPLFITLKYELLYEPFVVVLRFKIGNAKFIETV